MKNKVAVVMGSDSDLPVMKAAVEVLKSFEIEVVLDIVSAHRTPEYMFDFARNAESNGIQVIIAGAGGAAHLPGMLASLTHIPIIGVPVKSSNSLDGWDSILSILQMPNGIPVATVALNASKNAGIFAIQMLAIGDYEIKQKLKEFRTAQTESVAEKRNKLN
jgi:5-(carboxyamino)imidazole ribonucleotide mutase